MAEEKNATKSLTFEFKASLKENVTNILFVTAVFATFYLLRGYGIEKVLELVCVNALAGVLYMATDDLTCKYYNTQFRELINWQELVGVGAVIVSAISALFFVYSTTAWGWVALGIAAVLGGAAFYWFKVVYLKSILDTEGLDLYDRNRIAGRLDKALENGKKSVVIGLLGKTLRYRCSDNDYAKGSDYNLPFDEGKRTYRVLNRSKKAVDKETAQAVYKYLLYLESKLFAAKSVEVEFTTEETASIEEVKKGE